MIADYHRYCILGQPRCGSHHLASILYNQLVRNDVTALDIGEFLHWWSGRFAVYHIEQNQLIKTLQTTNYDPLVEVAKRQQFLADTRPNQPLVARLFFLDNMLVDFKDLAKTYQQAGFKFVYLKRDLEPQIISYYFSKDENIWTKFKFTNRKVIDIARLKMYILDFVKFRLYGEKWLSTVEHTVVNYEDLKDQPSDHFKMMTEDPYELVINKDEVRQVFAEYLPKARESLSSLILD